MGAVKYIYMPVFEEMESRKWRAGSPTVTKYIHRLSSPPGTRQMLSNVVEAILNAFINLCGTGTSLTCSFIDNQRDQGPHAQA